MMKKRDEEPHVRQVMVQRLNETIHVISTYREENVDFLISRVLHLLEEIKEK